MITFPKYNLSNAYIITINLSKELKLIQKMKNIIYFYLNFIWKYKSLNKVIGVKIQFLF